MATDLERFAKIIQDNPGATYRQDNDKWYIVKPVPVEYDKWPDSRQNDWWESESELCSSRNFPDYDWAGGALVALLAMSGLNYEEL